MNLKEAFAKISFIESSGLPACITSGSINTWPLLRQCLWFELTSVNNHSFASQINTLFELTRKKIVSKLRQSTTFSSSSSNFSNSSIALFISRPIYLQELSGGLLFDRIIDPLIYCLPDRSDYSKYYMSSCYNSSDFFYKASFLSPSHKTNIFISKEVRSHIYNIARRVGIKPKSLLRRYSRNLSKFTRWYSLGTSLLDQFSCLKLLFITSWYFPDAMGLIAAARERGITVIDVQHGKQGKFQAMYSGWDIQDETYLMMPDLFWCWGKPSVSHILGSRTSRTSHRPILGGYPWLEYYREKIMTASQFASTSSSLKRVLVTLQPTQGGNNEPLPDFIIEFLRTLPNNIYFVFRCHPNHRNAPEYCTRRLVGIPSSLFEIDDGRPNLYEQIMNSTHHITAYSSCCYEASAFNIPTLLFGPDAESIYDSEIQNGEFEWTIGRSLDLKNWLAKDFPSISNDKYIYSSLPHCRWLLNQLLESKSQFLL